MIIHHGSSFLQSLLSIPYRIDTPDLKTQLLFASDFIVQVSYTKMSAGKAGANTNSRVGDFPYFGVAKPGGAGSSPRTWQGHRRNCFELGRAGDETAWRVAREKERERERSIRAQAILASKHVKSCLVHFRSESTGVECRCKSVGNCNGRHGWRECHDDMMTLDIDREDDRFWAEIQCLIPARAVPSASQHGPDPRDHHAGCGSLRWNACQTSEDRREEVKV